MHMKKTILVLAGFALAACEKEEPARWSRLPGETPPEATAPAQPAATPGMGAMEMPRRAEVKATSDTLTAAGIVFPIPPGWEAGKPATSMRLAQYALPGEAGPAELAVFHFGKGQGGDVQSNLDRWIGQFSSDDATTTTDSATTATAAGAPELAAFENDGLKISIVRTAGTYHPTTMGPMAPPQEPLPDYALFGMVIEGGAEGSVFVKVTGPQATMNAQAEALGAFAKNVRREQ